MQSALGPVIRLVDFVSPSPDCSWKWVLKCVINYWNSLVSQQDVFGIHNTAASTLSAILFNFTDKTRIVLS